MKIIHKLIQLMGKKHAQRLGQLVNRQADPRFHKAILAKIDKTLFSQNGITNLNPEMEAMQDMFFEGLGLGGLDNIFDVIRYGRYALKGVKFKIAPYLTEYRQALNANLPPLRGRGFVWDFRKGEVTEREVNDALKNIFLRT